MRKYLVMLFVLISAIFFLPLSTAVAGEHGGQEHGGKAKAAKKEHGGQEHGGQKAVSSSTKGTLTAAANHYKSQNPAWSDKLNAMASGEKALDASVLETIASDLEAKSPGLSKQVSKLAESL